MDVLVFGSAIMDFISYVERLPKAGETLHGHKFATGFGGKGANQCVAAARLGAFCGMVAKLGDDAWGPRYLEYLRNECVNVNFVELCKDETTGIAQINVANNGENQIVIVVGANNKLSTADVIKAKEFFETAKVLVCQFETPLDATLEALRNFRGVSILNAAPALSETPPEILQAANILCVNEVEAALMTGCEEISTLEQSKEALKLLINMGARNVIITLGALGAVYIQSDNPSKIIHVPTVKVLSHNVVDTTGAGDAFIGSLAFFIARYPGKELHQQIGAACAVAAYSVQHPGTQTSFPTTKELKINFNKYYKWEEL